LFVPALSDEETMKMAEEVTSLLGTSRQNSIARITEASAGNPLFVMRSGFAFSDSETGVAL
jgi:hypothetical protein